MAEPKKTGIVDAYVNKRLKGYNPPSRRTADFLNNEVSGSGKSTYVNEGKGYQVSPTGSVRPTRRAIQEEREMESQKNAKQQERIERGNRLKNRVR